LTGVEILWSHWNSWWEASMLYATPIPYAGTTLRRLINVTSHRMIGRRRRRYYGH
jgi:hypothetical protein